MANCITAFKINQFSAQYCRPEGTAISLRLRWKRRSPLRFGLNDPQQAWVMISDVGYCFRWWIRLVPVRILRSCWANEHEKRRQMTGRMDWRIPNSDHSQRKNTDRSGLQKTRDRWVVVLKPGPPPPFQESPLFSESRSWDIQDFGKSGFWLRAASGGRKFCDFEPVLLHF